MRRLGLCFLLSCLGVLAALNGALAHSWQELGAPAEKPARQTVVALELVQPPKAEQKRPEPEPKPRPEPVKRPVAKPKPERLKPPEPKPEPQAAPKPEPVAEPETPPEPAAAVAEAPEPAAKTPDTAAVRPEEAAARRQAAENYFARLYRVIAEHKTYPSKARRFGVEGEVSVRFVIDDSGAIIRTEITRSSGSRVLDRSALAIFETIRDFEKPPVDVARRHYEIVLDYNLG